MNGFEKNKEVFKNESLLNVIKREENNFNSGHCAILVASFVEKVQYNTSICFNVIFFSAKQNNARAVKSRVPQY